MRIDADENVWKPVVTGLRRRGWDVSSVFDEGTTGDSDREHIERAAANEWVVLTFDDDFLSLAAESPSITPESSTSSSTARTSVNSSDGSMQHRDATRTVIRLARSSTRKQRWTVRIQQVPHTGKSASGSTTRSGSSGTRQSVVNSRS